MCESFPAPTPAELARRNARHSRSGMAGVVGVHSPRGRLERFRRDVPKLGCVRTTRRCRWWTQWNSGRGEKRSVWTGPTWRRLSGGRPRLRWSAKQRRELSRGGWRRGSTSWSWPATQSPVSWRIPSLEICARTPPMRRSGATGRSSAGFRRLSIVSPRPMRSVAGNGPASRLESFRRVRPSPGRALQRLDGAAAPSTYRIKVGSVRQPPSGGT